MATESAGPPATDVIDGQVVQGTYAKDGSFWSSDGHWYVPRGGPPEHGITDLSGNFLQNGVVRTIDGHQVYGTVQNGVFFSEDGKLEQLPDGFVAHGHTVQNPDGTATFIATYTLPDGTVLEGYYSSDHSFLSTDGKTYITSNGQVEHGITDLSGNFLQNGVVRTIDGHQVYGTVQNGVFFSEDGKLEQLPDGFVAHGHTVQNPDGTATFIATNTLPDRTVLEGYYSSDHSFLSTDGKTYITSNGQVEHGITDPSGNFLQNGVVRTIDGHQVYGTVQNGIFLSEDGKLEQLPDGFVAHGHTVQNSDGTGTFIATEIVLDKGLVLTGTYDPTTGIFTATNGDYLFMGQNGIQIALPQPDGSYQLWDGSVVMTPQAWKVDLAAMADSIALAKANSDGIAQEWSRIVNSILKVTQDGVCFGFPGYWRGPAGDTFFDVSEQFETAMGAVGQLLIDIISQLEQNYQNYVAVESANTQNLSA